MCIVGYWTPTGPVVDVLAYDCASFDVVGEVAPVALLEGDLADEAVPECW